MNISGRYVNFLLLCLIFCLIDCKKEEKEDEKVNTQQTFQITAFIENSPTQFPSYKYYLTENGKTFGNNLIFSKEGQEKIEINFLGDEKGTYNINPNGSDCIVRYTDQSGRVFTADSGAIDLSEFTYQKSIGKHVISGSFAFHSSHWVVNANPPYKINATCKNGAFVNLTNN